MIIDQTNTTRQDRIYFSQIKVQSMRHVGFINKTNKVVNFFSEKYVLARVQVNILLSIKKTFLEQVVGPNAHGSVDWAWKWAGLFGEAGVKVFWEGKGFLLKEVSHCPFFNFFIYLTWLRLHF